jgi:hypothetical protein
MHTDRSIVSARGLARKPAAVIALALALLNAVPGVVLAGSPTIVHDHYTDHVFLTADEFCGFPVDDDVVVNTVWRFNADGSFSATGSHRDTYTNPANGKSVVVTGAGPFSLGPRIVDERAGTYTVTVGFKGLGIKVATQHGGILLRDAGLLSFTDTFLLATDEKIATTVIENGPHPDADSGFSLFCDVMWTALS